MKTHVMLWLFVASLLWASACSVEDGIESFDGVIVESTSNSNKFKQLTFTLSLQNDSSGYVNVPRIDSVRLKVNGKEWGVFSSEVVDTTGRTDKVQNNIGYSAAKISYLIIAPYVLRTDNIETAGALVAYLNNRIVLSPGDYVCELTEVKFRNRINQWVALKPQLYKDFKVTESTASSFVGDITATLK